MIEKNTNFKILVVDDEKDIRDMLETYIVREGYQVSVVKDGNAAIEKTNNEMFDLLLLDIRMPQKGGLEVLEIVKREHPNIPVIMLSAYDDQDNVGRARDLGAEDFISKGKPFEREELCSKIKRAIETEREKRVGELLYEEEKRRYQFPNIIWKSKKMEELITDLKRVIPTDTTVLVQGESGTGKELIAKAVHYNSPRAKNPFITVNCPTLPEHSLESELFGYVKGAFTGANPGGKPGMFELADGGTIFLDEIGDITLPIQSKLLRVIQEKEFMRLSGITSIKVNVRIVAATSVDLAEAVKEKKFLDALYHRLNVVTIYLCPLKERKDDIPLLLDHYLDYFSKELNRPNLSFSSEAKELLSLYNYEENNVRELRNIVERTCIFSESDIISAESVEKSLPFVSENVTRVTELKKFSEAKEDFERDYIFSVLVKTKGNIAKAAGIAGLDRNNFKGKMKKYDIDADSFKK